MSNFDELIPGLESFMEDTTVETKVEVSDGDAAADAEVTAGEEEEVAEASEEVEETGDQAEMILAHYDRVDAMMAHIERYGADRTFFSLMNADGYLSNMLQRRGVVLPSLESIDATGTPGSELSMACMEGLREIADTVWDFITRMAMKATTTISRMKEAIRQRCQSLESNIARLRRVAMSKRESEPRTNASGAKVYTLAQLRGLLQALPNNAAAKANQLVTTMGKAFDMIKSGNAGGIQNLMSSLESMYTDAKAASKVFKDAKKAIKGERVAMSEVSIQDTMKMLDFAESIIKQVEENGKALENLKATLKAFNSIAKGRSVQEGVDYRKSVRALAKMAVKVAKVLPKFGKQQLRVATLCVRNAGQRLAVSLGRYFSVGTQAPIPLDRNTI